MAIEIWDADGAELADAPDLGSGASRRGGSSLFSFLYQTGTAVINRDTQQTYK